MNLVLESIELPIRIRPDRMMTDEELERFSRQNKPMRVELDSTGELIVMSLNWTEGGGVEFQVALDLGKWTEIDGRGRCFGGTTGFRLADGSVRAPDAAWVSWSKWNALAPEQRSKYAQVCPEFVIEVWSDSDRLPVLPEKMGIWIANGAELGWLIDPKRRVVEIYRPGEEAEVHQDPTSVQASGCVRGFELVMARVWS
jgi:Uma2 family endonuclease